MLKSDTYPSETYSLDRAVTINEKTEFLLCSHTGVDTRYQDYSVCDYS